MMRQEWCCDPPSETEVALESLLWGRRRVEEEGLRSPVRSALRQNPTEKDLVLGGGIAWYLWGGVLGAFSPGFLVETGEESCVRASAVFSLICGEVQRTAVAVPVISMKK